MPGEIRLGGEASGPIEGIARLPQGKSLGEPPGGRGIAPDGPGKYGFGRAADSGGESREQPLIQASTGGDTPQPGKSDRPPTERAGNQPEPPKKSADRPSTEESGTIPKSGDVFIADSSGQPKEPQQPKEGAEETEATERRGELTLDEVGKRLAVTATNEARALLLSAMQEGIDYTLRDLMREANRLGLGGQNKNQLVRYWRDSFVQAGLAESTEEGCRKTEKGSEQDALNGQLLYFSGRNPEHFLGDFFPSSSAPGAKTKREEGPEGEEIEKKANPTLLRFRILQQLVSEDPPKDLSALCRKLGEKGNIVGMHLQNLSDNGIIEYSSSSADKKRDRSKEEYTITDVRSDKVPPYDKNVTLTQEAYAVVAAAGSLSTEEVYAKLQEKEGRSLNIYRVSSILLHLEREGYLKGKPAISLTSQQREMISELVTIVKNFQKGDTKFLEAGKEKAQDIVVLYPERAAALMHKAQERSKRVNPKVTRMQIREIVANVPPEGLSPREIYQTLRERGNNLSLARVTKFMQEMRGKDVRVVRVEGRTNFYGPVQEESPSEQE